MSFCLPAVARTCANTEKMLGVLLPKNHTVAIYRRTFRLGRVEVHLDLWVSEELVGRRGAARRHSSAEECEVHENAALTDVLAEALTDLPTEVTDDPPQTCSQGPRGAAARRGSPSKEANSIVHVERAVIVEPRPADEESEARSESRSEALSESRTEAARTSPSPCGDQDQAAEAKSAKPSASQGPAEHPGPAEASKDKDTQGGDVPDESVDEPGSSPRKSIETAV